MVKPINSFTNSGVADWAWQRYTAVIMTVYILSMFGYVFTHQITYASWSALFELQIMKLATFTFIGCLIIHAWIGIWTVITDYVKCPVASRVLNGIFILGYFVCFAWSAAILWG